MSLHFYESLKSVFNKGWIFTESNYLKANFFIHENYCSFNIRDGYIPVKFAFLFPVISVLISYLLIKCAFSCFLPGGVPQQLFFSNINPCALRFAVQKYNSSCLSSWIVVMYMDCIVTFWIVYILLVNNSKTKLAEQMLNALCFSGDIFVVEF